jgi:hypothetical protein
MPSRPVGACHGGPIAINQSLLGNTLEASILGSEAGVDAAQELVGERLSSYWKATRSIGYAKFTVKICLMFLNLAMVSISFLHRNSRIAFAERNFLLVRDIMVWTEFAIVWASAVRIPSDILLISKFRAANLPDLRPTVMQTLNDNLDIAASFSILEFLPVPSKLQYWWSHRQRIWQKYFVKPPVMQGESIWDPEKLNRTFRETFDITKVSMLTRIIVVPVLLLCFFVVQVVVPIFLSIAPFLAFPAFLVKMQALPNVTELAMWRLGPWITAMGVANQVSKMWSVDIFEKLVSFEAAGKIIALHTGACPEKIDAQRIFGRALEKALGPLDGTIAMGTLSAGEILREVYMSATEEQ